MSVKLINILKEEVSEQLQFLVRPYVKNAKTGKYQKNLGWDYEKNRYSEEGEYSDLGKEEKLSGIYDAADTTKYPYLEFTNRTKNDGINPTLLKDVNTAAEKSGIKVQITYAITGHDKGPNTRHDEGEAVDLSVLNGVGSGDKNFKTFGDKFIEELKKLGYKSGESGCGKSYLWQTEDHYDHIHASYKPC